jgi:hypothetical protein
MEVKWREVRHLRQGLKVQKLIEMLIYVIGYPMHAVDIHIAALGCAHRCAVRLALRLADVIDGHGNSDAAFCLV